MKTTSVTVSFSCTIPTQAYGNIGVNTTWTADLDEGESPEAATKEIFGRIRTEISKAVMPIAEAKLKQTRQVVESLPPKERDALMQQLGIVQWLETVSPELKFAEPAPVAAGEA